MDNDFLDILQSFFKYTSAGDNSTEPPCVEKVDHYKFYQYSLIPAVLMCCLFAASKTRRTILLTKLGGRPGLVYPMDTLTRAQSFSYACAFGVTGFVVYRILDQQQFAVQYTGPLTITSLIAVLSMFIYGIVFFPVFASLALATATSYGLGALYVWMFFIVELYKVTECRFSAKGRLLLIFRHVPVLFCLAYLGISLPIRCVLAARQKYYFSSTVDVVKYETLQEIRESYQGIHVREIFQVPVEKPPPVGRKEVIRHKLKTFVHRYIYQRKKGFEFPSRLVSVMFIAGCVVYAITVEILVFFISALNFFIQLVEQNRTDGTHSALYGIFYVMKVSLIVSVTFGCLSSLLTILHMMTSFRRNLFALYRGDFRLIPPSTESSAVNLCLGSIKFAGYQVAYIFWSYGITVFVLFCLCIICAAVISLLMAGVSAWLVDVILQLWPSVLIGVVLYVVQYCVARWCFLQDQGQHLRLNNRRFYFIFTYFMFFYNIFMGLMSCLLRIIKAIVVGIILLARLDNSTLPRSFEFFDPGFTAYQGFIHLEVAHTHPVVNVFIRLVTTMSKERMDSRPRLQNTTCGHLSVGRQQSTNEKSDMVQRTRRARDAARFNWHVTYTLLHNPMIRIYRKGYIQALRKAQQEGLKVPISDKLFTDFDLVKSREQKEQERQLELELIRASKLRRQEEEEEEEDFEVISPDVDLTDIQVVALERMKPFYDPTSNGTPGPTLTTLV